MKNSINFTYKLVWNAKAGMYIPVAESSSSVGKRKAIKAACLTAMLSASTLLAQPGSNELPTGGAIQSGSATISKSNNTLNINQSSDKLITNWDTFDIGSDATVNFLQPSSSSVALNRVLSSKPSEIYGKLNANGQVFLINASGIFFAKGAQVDTGGLVASTLDISNKDFLNETYKFIKEANSIGEIYNLGDITSDDNAYVAFISPKIVNEGNIKAKDGSVLLAAADEVTVSFDAQGLINFTIDKNVVDAMIDNKGLIQVNSGTALLSAKAVDMVSTSVINNSGRIEANSLVSKGGRILLTSDDITIESTAKLDASGETGGGQIQIGGSWQNSDKSVAQSVKATVKEGAVLDASAKTSGNGGEIVVWSNVKNKNSITTVSGTLLAKGGDTSGDGGEIETSGHQVNLEDVTVHANAVNGKNGLWLTDPTNISINQATANTYSATLTGGTDVTIQSDALVAGDGDIFLDGSITNTGTTEVTLRFNAYRDLYIDNAISSTNGKLNVYLNSNRGDNGGSNRLRTDGTTGSVSTNGGYFYAYGGSSGTGYSEGGLNTLGFMMQTNSSISTAGGDIIIKAKGKSSGGAGIRIYGGTIQTTDNGATGGSITLDGQGVDDNSGVYFSGEAATTISAGTGGLSITGTGGTASAGAIHRNGIEIDAANGITLQATNGNINLTGNASANTTDSTQYGAGIWIDNGNVDIQTTTSGNINITGTSTSTNNGGHGLYTGTSYEGGGSNYINVSAAGNVLFTTTGTSNHDLVFRDRMAVTSTAGGDLTFNANTLHEAHLSEFTTSGNVIFAPRTNSTEILIGDAGNLAGTNPSGKMILAAGLFDGNIMNASSIQIGSLSHTGGMIVDSTISGTNSFLELLTGGNIAINSALNVNTNNLHLNVGGTVSQTAAITVSGLKLSGGGNFTLNNTSNNISTLATTSIGSLNYVDNDALSIGTVDLSNGINSSGTVAVTTQSGDLTINQGISTSNTSSSAIILNAGNATAALTSTGGDIIYSNGSISTGSGGRATLYTGSLSGSTAIASYIGNGSGNFRYGSSNGTSNYTTALGSGNYLVYRESPSISVKAADYISMRGIAPNPTSFDVGSGTLYNGDDVNAMTSGMITSTADYASGLGTYDLTVSGLPTYSTYGYTFLAPTVNSGGHTIVEPYNSGDVVNEISDVVIVSDENNILEQDSATINYEEPDDIVVDMINSNSNTLLVQNNGDKEAGAGGSDENDNTISGEWGNQGNDKLVGNAGGERTKITKNTESEDLDNRVTIKEKIVYDAREFIDNIESEVNISEINPESLNKLISEKFKILKEPDVTNKSKRVGSRKLNRFSKQIVNVTNDFKNRVNKQIKRKNNSVKNEYERLNKRLENIELEQDKRLLTLNDKLKNLLKGKQTDKALNQINKLKKQITNTKLKARKEEDNALKRLNKRLKEIDKNLEKRLSKIKDKYDKGLKKVKERIDKVKAEEKNENNKDSKSKDSKDKDSKSKDSKDKDSRDKKDKDSKVKEDKDSKSKDSKDKDSKEKLDKDSKSKDKDSKDKDSGDKKDKDSKVKEDKDSKSKDSKTKDDKDSKDKDSGDKKDKDSKEKEDKDSKTKDSKDKDSGNKDDKDKGSKTKDDKDSGNKEDKDSKVKEDKDSKSKDSKTKDDKDSGDKKDKDSKTKDDKDSKSKDSKDDKDKDSKEKEDKDSKTKDDKDSKSKDSKNDKDKDSKEKEDKDSKTKDDKDSKVKEDKDSKSKDSKDKDSKSKDSKDKDSGDKKDKDSKVKEDKDSKDKDSGNKEDKDSGDKKDKDSNIKPEIIIRKPTISPSGEIDFSYEGNSSVTNDIPGTGRVTSIQVVVYKAEEAPYAEKGFSVKQTKKNMKLKPVDKVEETFAAPGDIEDSILFVSESKNTKEKFIAHIAESGIVIKPLNKDGKTMVEEQRDLVISYAFAELYKQREINITKIRTVYIDLK